MKTCQIAFLVLTMLFAALLLAFSEHSVRYVLACAPFLFSCFVLCLICTEYCTRAAPEDEEEGAAAHKLTAMDLTRFSCCGMLVFGALLDTLRICFGWSMLVGFSFFTFTMALAVLVAVLIEGVVHYLGL